MSIAITYTVLCAVLGTTEALNLAAIARDTGSALLPTGAKLYPPSPYSEIGWAVSGYACDGSDVLPFLDAREEARESGFVDALGSGVSQGSLNMALGVDPEDGELY